jgi:hypothetical protein
MQYVVCQSGFFRANWAWASFGQQGLAVQGSKSADAKSLLGLLLNYNISQHADLLNLQLYFIAML